MGLTNPKCRWQKKNEKMRNDGYPRVEHDFFASNAGTFDPMVCTFVVISR